jgi:hypothetical protein
MICSLALLGLIVALRVIFGPYVVFVDKLAGANGRNSPLHIRMRRGPFQAAVFAQELWESNHALLRLIPGRSRGMELFSHEIEAQAAGLIYGSDIEAYRYAEARRMGGYRQLAGLTPDEIEEGMRASAARALAWVQKHRKAIEAAKDR